MKILLEFEECCVEVNKIGTQELFDIIDAILLYLKVVIYNLELTGPIFIKTAEHISHLCDKRLVKWD
jgi:hypothetical protein